MQYLSAEILEQMQAQIAEMQATIEQQKTEIAELKIKRSDLIEGEEGEETKQPTSRRKALKKIMVAAVGTAAVGTAVLSTNGGTAQAAGGSTPFIGWYAFPGSHIPPTNLPQIVGLAGSNESDFGDVENKVTAGVYGFSPGAVGVFGKSNTGNGVTGESNTRDGLVGRSISGNGLFAKSTSGNGVSGQSISNTGVFGSSKTGFGVKGFSESETGVVAQSTNFNALAAAALNGGTGVLATSSTGKAVYGRSAEGYGAEFDGGKAPLRLDPSNTQIGAPTSGDHQAGELFVDKNGTLFYCAISGTPGEWQALSRPVIITK
jgi:hypothetical protein